MTTRKKILSGFITIFVFGLILGICGLTATSMLTNLAEEQHALQEASAGVSSVLNAHYVWRQNLTEAVLSGTAFTGSLDSNTCALGAWRSSDQAKSVTDPELLTLLDKITAPHAYIHSEAALIVSMIEAGDMESARLELTEQILPQTAIVISALTDMEARYASLLTDKSNEIVRAGNTMVTLIVVVIGLSFVLCTLAAWFVTSHIMRPIREMARTAETISTGDLDVQIGYTVKDEIGGLADAFRSLLANTRTQVAAAEDMAGGDLTVDIVRRSDKDAMNIALARMVGDLNTMFSEIKTASSQVSTGAGHVSQSAQALATGSSQQAASVEALSNALAELQKMTDSNAEDSVKAQKANAQTDEKLAASIRSMGQMLESMRAIDESSTSITRVIKVIDDIAFQTNILALNAAVEAARAGVHGKGFAVVAEEVRNLAAKSAEAARETAALIAGSAARVKEGNEIVARTNADLGAAVENARESTRLVEQVAASSLEQAKSITEISQGMEQISTVVQANSATAEQSAAASQQMSAQAVVMNDIVAKFRLKDGGGRQLGAPAQERYPALGAPRF